MTIYGKGCISNYRNCSLSYVWYSVLNRMLTVIPAQDYDFLYQAGVVAIFGPGTSVAKAACQIMDILLED